MVLDVSLLRCGMVAGMTATHRWLETSRGILRYSELAPLLAERVLRIQERIEAGDYAAAPLDENLIRTLFRADVWTCRKRQ